MSPETSLLTAAEREALEHTQVSLERVRSLDAEERADGSPGMARDDLVRRPHLAELAAAAHYGLVERVDLLVNGSRQPARATEEREGYEPEELATHAPGAHARNVDVSADRRAGKGRRVTREEVVRQPSRPHQCVRVQVDRRIDVEERACLG